MLKPPLSPLPLRHMWSPANAEMNGSHGSAFSMTCRASIPTSRPRIRGRGADGGRRVRQAVEAQGQILSADHQNKPDVGAEIARAGSTSKAST